MKAKFKKPETAIQRRDQAVLDIFTNAEFLMRLSDNHPDVAPKQFEEQVRTIAHLSLYLNGAYKAHTHKGELR